MRRDCIKHVRRWRSPTLAGEATYDRDTKMLLKISAARAVGALLFAAWTTSPDTVCAQAMPGMDMPPPPLATQPPASGAMRMEMMGFFGPYAMSREASGTSWQPESSPHDGLHFSFGQWMLMVHGYADAIYDNQGGRRGADKTFSASMGMLMAQRRFGPGTLGLRAMISLDPLMGPNGYPLLFATGETADGRRPLVDRQHPHDLFMELSASYSLPLSDHNAVFVYGGPAWRGLRWGHQPSCIVRLGWTSRRRRSRITGWTAPTSLTAC